MEIRVATDTRRQFVDEVFPAELEEIRRRRATLGMSADALEGPPSTSLGLVGLAFSGGGIRSATFALGAVQALARHRIFRFVDYLSTVSGGGYIGSCLSSLLNVPSAGPDPERFPLHLEPGVEEPPAVRHLRNSGKYLAPGGFFDVFRIPTLFLRGILINLLVFLPYIMGAVFLTEIVYLYTPRHGQLYTRAPVVTMVGFFLLVLSYPFVWRVWGRRFVWAQRNGYELLLTFSLFVFIVAVALVPSIAVVRGAIDLTWTDVIDWVRGVALEPRTTGYWPWFVLTGVLAVFMLAARLSAQVSRWTGQAALSLVGLLGPAAQVGIYLLLVVLVIQSPVLSDRYVATFDAGQLPADVRAVLADKNLPLSPSARVAVIVPGASWRIDDGAQHYPVRFQRGRLKIDADTTTLSNGDLGWWFYGAWALLIALNVFFVDVNVTSVHGFYRDRLTRAYLVQLRDRRVTPNDIQKLSTLNAPGTAAPYHLVNVTLNVPASRDPNLRGRRSDFFIFSKHFVGGTRTGYCPTARMERADGHLDLGTAMAISGAAAAPNMGTTTVRALVFIMTMLNIRLGYWLCNPRRVQSARWRPRLLLPPGAGPRYLWREAVGRMDEHHRYVNVSDGGHLENLGIYELLRRRCRLIIAVDGEADPELRFVSLVHLIRFARIDMGVLIDIDIDRLRRGDDQLSREHVAIGTIRYGGGQIGHLVYVKSCLTGDENDYVRAYHGLHPAFPHESTTNQFFGETQFEVYRALGYHIVNRLCTDPRAQEAMKSAGLPVPVV